MCAIEEVRSYRYGGKHYETELEAVTAALQEIASRIIKDHHSHPLEGLLKYGNDIGELRSRYGALSLPGNAVEVTSEKAEGGPKSGGPIVPGSAVVAAESHYERTQRLARMASPHSSDGIGG